MRTHFISAIIIEPCLTEPTTAIEESHNKRKIGKAYLLLNLGEKKKRKEKRRRLSSKTVSEIMKIELLKAGSFSFLSFAYALACVCARVRVFVVLF